MKTLSRNFVVESFGSLLHDRRGGLGVAAAFLAPVLVGAAMMGVDSSRIATAQHALNAATDTATQNVATMLEELPDPEAEGNKFFYANFPEGKYNATLLQNANGSGPLALTHQKVNDELEVTGHAAADIPLIFGGMVGMSTYRIQHTAVVVRSIAPNVEIVFALKTSPRMCALTLPSAQAAGVVPASGSPTGTSGPSGGGAGGSVSGGRGASSAGNFSSVGSSSRGRGSSSSPRSSSSSAGSSLSPRSSSSSAGSSSSSSAKLDPDDFSPSESMETAAAAAGVTPDNEGDNPQRIVPDPNCRKLEAMKSAVKDFINHTYANTAIKNVKVGIVTFNHKVRYPDTNNIPPSIAAGEVAEPDYYTNFSDAEPLTVIQPLTTDKNTLLAAVDAIHQDVNGFGWSRNNLGFWSATLMLDPAQHAYYGGEEPKPLGDPKVEKIVVLVSDGPSVGAAWSVDDFGNTENQYLYIYKTDQNDLATRCADAKRPAAQDGAGIKVFSILFDVPEGTWYDPHSENISSAERLGDEWTHEVHRGCATNPQYFFDVPAASLEDPDNIGGPLKQAMSALSWDTYRVRFKY